MSNRTTSDSILTHNRAVLLKALQAAGATTAVLSYSGYGDDGSANEIRVIDAAGHALPGDSIVTIQQLSLHFAEGQWHSTVVATELSLRDALDAFADLAVDRHHPGYENNQGGDGEITFDCAAGTVRMEHRDHFVNSYLTCTDL